MITRSAIQKGFANECEVAKPLSPVTKKRIKSTVKAKMNIQGPLKNVNNETNSQTNLENVQSPVFNIHVHMPTIEAGDLNKSSPFQPVIHLHFDGLLNGLPSDFDATSRNVEIISEISKVELLPQVNCSCEEQSNWNESSLPKPLSQNKICRRLTFSKSSKRNESSKVENAKAVVKSSAEIEENEEFATSSFCKKQLPVRRSIRQENNRKLLEMMKDFSENKGNATNKKSKKPFRNIRTRNESGSLIENLNLKEPVIILQDIMKVMKEKNITFCNDEIGKEQDDCLSPNDPSATSACDGSERVENNSCDLLGESVNEQNSVMDEENEKNLKQNSDDQNVISVCKKFGEIYSLVYSSDNETSSANDFADKNLSENLGINFGNEVELEKGSCETPLDNCTKDTENCRVNNGVALHPVQENDLSNLVSKDKDSSLNLRHFNKNDVIESLNSKSSDSSSDNESNSDNSDFELPEASNVKEDNHQCESPKVSDVESKKDNLGKNIIEEKLSSTEANGNKETNVETINFQIDLIKKEMKKRDLVVKEKLSMKKKKTESQAKLKISDEVLEKSTAVKKVKLSKEPTKDKTASENVEKAYSADDYIPLKVSGPTKFAVAQLNKVKSFNGHAANNFRNEKLFSNRVKRYSHSKQSEIYRLKKKASEMRKK